MPWNSKHTDRQARYADRVFEITDALRAIRRAKGLSQRSVSYRMGVTQSQVHYFENHRSEPRLSSLFEYADQLGVQIKITLEVTTDGQAGNTQQAGQETAQADRQTQGASQGELGESSA